MKYNSLCILYPELTVRTYPGTHGSDQGVFISNFPSDVSTSSLARELRLWREDFKQAADTSKEAGKPSFKEIVSRIDNILRKWKENSSKQHEWWL